MMMTHRDTLIHPCMYIFILIRKLISLHVFLQVASVTFDLLLLLVLGSYLIVLFSFLVITTRVYALLLQKRSTSLPLYPILFDISYELTLSIKGIDK